MTDQQFMAGVWQKVDALEREEREIQKARQRNRQLWRRSLGVGALVLLLLMAYLAAPMAGVSYAVFVLFFVAAFLCDLQLNSTKEVSSNVQYRN